MSPKLGLGLKAPKLNWQRALSTKSARLCIAAAGCVALVTYIWVVFFLHPANVETNIRNELRIGQATFSGRDTAPAAPGATPVRSPPPLNPPRHPPLVRPPPPLLPEAPKPLRHYPHKDAKYRIWKLPAVDKSPRCRNAGICDGNYDCGADGLGCIRDALQRKEKVREAARWTWKGYRQYAWGHDELNAGSRNAREWFSMGLTIVDSLDTLQLLGLLEEYAEARFWVANHLDFNQREVSVFETTIRILGGLVAAFYHSGGDELFLLKAVEFGERLLPAFQTSTGLPVPRFDVHDKGTSRGRSSVGSTCLAEIGTLSMEFTALARASGQPKFHEVGMSTWRQISAMSNMDGLYCTFLNGDSLSCNGDHYTFGASADSTYEYMLKQWILSAGNDTICIDLYKRAIQGMRKHMLTQLWMGEDVGDVWIAADNDNEDGMTKTLALQHLTCFLPGTMALGHMYGIKTTTGPSEDDDLTVAVKLMKACYELYHQAPSGIAYDSVRFAPHYWPPPPPPPSPPPTNPPPASSPPPPVAVSEGQGAGTSVARGAGVAAATSGNAAGGGGGQAAGQGGGAARRRLLEDKPANVGKVMFEMSPLSRENFLRPEVAESLFYLWRATGDPIYREWGWGMFRAYERWCRVETGGYQTTFDVTHVPPRMANKMESFWMAETLKYFYLLFSDDPQEVPLDEFVFNTEAHPLAIRGSKTDVKLREALARVHGSGGGQAGEVLNRLTKMVPALSRTLQSRGGKQSTT